MPIKPCTCPGGGKGKKWGDHGHCYCGKGAAGRAAKQAAAAYAHGYTGEGYGNRFFSTVRRLLEKVRRRNGG